VINTCIQNLYQKFCGKMAIWNDMGRSTASRLALVTTQLPVQWVLGALSLGVKWLVCEADHSPPSSTAVKEGGAMLLLSHIPSWCGA
jgi:hypothetical protein